MRTISKVYNAVCFGDDPVSTWVTKQCRAYRGSDYLVNTAETSIVANDETYSLAA